MTQGIALMGLNGAGKSTLAHNLSQHLGFYEMDMEDYYFPEQKNSRQNAIKNQSLVSTEHDGKLPFSFPQSKTNVETSLRRDILFHPRFVISGVTMNWSIDILLAIKIAFLMEVPLDVRLKRIQDREVKRFGTRVLPGGDMYDQQIEFLRTVTERNKNIVYASAQKLRCPVIKLDGTKPICENMQRIIIELETNK